MSDLTHQLKTPITEQERKDAWKEHTNHSSPRLKTKVIFLDLGPDDAANVRVYEFLSGFMDESRIIVVGGARGLERYVPMPRIHDYTGVEDWAISCGRTLHGEDDVKSAFYNLTTN